MASLKSKSIYESLRERILSDDISPGERLVMRRIATEYNSSDIPVREALRMLERDGLVETVPYKGAHVTKLSAREIDETYFIRAHLESIATGLAAERITEATLAKLDVIMEDMRAAVRAGEGPHFSDLNRTFHTGIIENCGNGMLRDLTLEIWQRHSGFQRVFRLDPKRIEISQAEHEGIMDALRARDSKTAAALALKHKRSVGRSVRQLVVDPEFSSDEPGEGDADVTAEHQSTETRISS